MTTMRTVYQPDGSTLHESGFDFCPGCSYGSIVLCLAEVIEQLSLDRPPLFLLDIGCVDFMVGHLPGQTMMGPHGRTPALASGVKAVDPDRLVVAIQGDGGFMSVGAGEALHAAMRGDPFTVLLLNNGVLADTGGQFAPSTLPGVATSTAPASREGLGAPLPYVDMLAGLDGVSFAERVSLGSVPGIKRLGKALARAFEVQRAGSGLGIVEALTACPTHWRMEPEQSWAHIRDRVAAVYPPGVLRDRAKEEA